MHHRAHVEEVNSHPSGRRNKEKAEWRERKKMQTRECGRNRDNWRAQRQDDRFVCRLLCRRRAKGGGGEWAASGLRRYRGPWSGLIQRRAIRARITSRVSPVCTGSRIKGRRGFRRRDRGEIEGINFAAVREPPLVISASSVPSQGVHVPGDRAFMINDERAIQLHIAYDAAGVFADADAAVSNAAPATLD